MITPAGVTDAMAATGIPSLTDLLGQFPGGEPPEGVKVEADVSVSSDGHIDELRGDGINNERYGYPDERHVSHEPEPDDFVSPVQPANVCHVPISIPEKAASFNACTPVIKNPHFSGHANALSVLASMGRDEEAATSAPVLGLLTRAAQLLLCRETGASASLYPNVSEWDVRVADLTNSSAAMTCYPGYVPVHLPYDMSCVAAQALISICVPGGAAAYDWRFRPGGPDNDRRAAMMPAYARKLYPGGNAQVLMITEHASRSWVFGGAAFTRAGLRDLERWLRAKFGHGLVDQAFKTAAALGHVYVEPRITEGSLGDMFDIEQATCTYDGHDLSSNDFAWEDDGGNPRDPILRGPVVDQERRPLGFDDAVIIALRALHDNPKANGHASSTSQACQPVDYENACHPHTCSRVDNKRKVACDAPLVDVLRWLRDPTNVQDPNIVDFAQGWLQMLDGGLSNQYLGYPEEDDWSAMTKLCGFRNSFGHHDHAAFCLPGFNLRALTPLLSGFHIINVNFGIQSSLDAENRRDRLRHYVHKMHIAHVFSCVGKNIWPDMLDLGGYTHAQLAILLPRGLQALTYLIDGGRSKLSAPNWQILEPVHRLKGTRSKTAYYGYTYVGEWAMHDSCVDVNNSLTSIAALDAALRKLWVTGGRVNVVNHMEQPFTAVRDLNNLYAPLSFAPVVQEGSSIISVQLHGADSHTLGQGHADRMYAVVAR
ncbi:hypothetical protein P168DRAFT_292969 [Aspergillus campestris IBT 28561]|uniref:Uncharacterized protein n=1 Tax=Aspergillus campestris (strain IBT 28561) TaxID=1392248 RepID=A0A2I1CTZ2_ASPC2|nr:uncharacterized protein P168DRAFT_292969 [Aspergillus campestris IBT 28561]PKY01085.1 hypothetical protein P168DRAFT_292969 [Aspergillus campestris IBT 28561]